MDIGPAPTMGRELVVIVVNIAIIGVLFVIIGSNPVFWILVAALAVYAGIRFVIGLRGWNRAEAQR
ncbi:hypothetical protein G9444_6346 [Rhodococcus erythropolis]|jgi:hypothetical protein|uniref:Uncharacterized protein n=2 Tax=Nocardiaceae TaxID=85025 RepID=A0A6G9D329_RHOER|nr:hypothetical protein AS032_30540 [Rhodococcus qingshengii]MBW0294079.1 hypothetical protein [Rhodococcus sp. MH15]OFE08508.1 hypothetical protein A5N83_12200 [Rhodococcus sp. 1139]QIP43589.1 hypothetical protein G9444_6346 [Rhodococcus erythropolis]